MKKSNRVTRREFIATTSLALVASQLPGAAADQSAPESTKLALNGGTKAVPMAPTGCMR